MLIFSFYTPCLAADCPLSKLSLSTYFILVIFSAFQHCHFYLV
nr:MAG TPA: hypothetical protein [Caudoviricetes sp.]